MSSSVCRSQHLPASPSPPCKLSLSQLFKPSFTSSTAARLLHPSPPARLSAHYRPQASQPDLTVSLSFTPANTEVLGVSPTSIVNPSVARSTQTFRCVYTASKLFNAQIMRHMLLGPKKLSEEVKVSMCRLVSVQQLSAASRGCQR